MRSARPVKTIDPAQNRADILRSAARCFAEFGFHGTSIDRIASEAGVSKSLALYHFGNKETLWQEVLRQKTSRFYAVAEALAETENPITVDEMVRSKFEALRNDPELARLIGWVSMDPSLVTDDLKQIGQKASKRIHARREGMGIPDTVPPEIYMATLMAAVDGFFRFRHVYSAMFGADLSSDEAENAFLQTILNQLQTKKAS